MSISGSIAPHLPFLRRFARALTGSQSSGDAYTVATLETISSAGNFPSDSNGARIRLYSIFLKIWSSMSINQRSDIPVGESQIAAADQTLEALTPEARVAFLLRALEEFKTNDIAEIMGKTPEHITTLLEQAGREIANQLSTDVLIIEDEPVIALDLETLVSDLGHRVTRVARTHSEAVAAIRSQAPGLVLADIQLADGSSGLDAVNDILGECVVPVIFITAYPERLLTGERPEPTFLITKPFRHETVMAIISQALFFNLRASLNKH